MTILPDSDASALHLHAAPADAAAVILAAVLIAFGQMLYGPYLSTLVTWLGAGALWLLAVPLGCSGGSSAHAPSAAHAPATAWIRAPPSVAANSHP